jgi:RNA polymerase sigma-54 factor
MAGPGMHQSQNLSLQQVLAPQLQQSLLILQAPLLELRNLVQQEMETNPVLEELATEIGSDEGEEPKTDSSAADETFKEEFDQLAKLDDEWRDYMAQSGSYTRALKTRTRSASSSSIRSRRRRRCSST